MADAGNFGGSVPEDERNAVRSLQSKPFPVSMMGSMIMSHLFYPEGNDLPGYDWSRILGQTKGTDFDFHALADALDCQRDFYGAGIIYNDGYRSFLVRPSHRSPAPGQNQITHVVVTQTTQLSREGMAKSVKEAVKDPSIGTEIASTVLSCGAAVLTAVAWAASVGSVPLTGGMSTPLAVLATAGTVATGLQCLNGLVRMVDIAFNDGQYIDWVDTQGWYIATTSALDIISLASLGGPLKEAVMTYKTMKSVSSLKVIDWLKRYPRMERVRLTEGIIKQLNPGISNKTMKAMIRAGKYPRRYPSEALHRDLIKQLISAITSTMAVSGSAVSGVIRSPGSINTSGEYVF
ncbi:hypothetical protein NFJ76_03545 [Citrobacter freundii]|uniref:hypothetical protein n=1 Tax=Citrobacter freundii TaxID=546 RepID=UPI00242CF6A6|nr:hypothetical protein [Citrobacter freundii]WFW61076.1 hypothetical protein NFJ76_03545 [Citrobacter freundii]